VYSLQCAVLGYVLILSGTFGLRLCLNLLTLQKHVDKSVVKYFAKKTKTSHLKRISFVAGVHVHFHGRSRLQDYSTRSVQIPRRQVELLRSCHCHSQSRRAWIAGRQGSFNPEILSSG